MSDLTLKQQLDLLGELGPIIVKLIDAHPRMEMLLAHGVVGLVTPRGVFDVMIIEHEEHVKSRAATDLLLEGCRQFIFDAFDRHGYELHEDGCEQLGDCTCPRVVQANDLLRGWVAK